MTLATDPSRDLGDTAELKRGITVSLRSPPDERRTSAHAENSAFDHAAIGAHGEILIEPLSAACPQEMRHVHVSGHRVRGASVMIKFRRPGQRPASVRFLPRRRGQRYGTKLVSLVALWNARSTPA
jgi:hypothetical protein